MHARVAQPRGHVEHLLTRPVYVRATIMELEGVVDVVAPCCQLELIRKCILACSAAMPEERHQIPSVPGFHPECNR